MFTVLVILTNQELVTYYVRYFQSQAQAQAFQPKSILCQVQAIVMPGYYSEEEAIIEYLD